ncbi:MAG: diguanylate cyclase domain-containing protein [Solirubrobacteraceae bacterium]
MGRSLPHERLLAILETQNEIAASAMELEAVIELVVRRARLLTGADAAVLELQEGEEMVFRAATGSAERFLGSRLPVADSVSAQCARVGEILHCRDAETDGRVNVEACRRLGAVSLLCVPLSRAHGSLGALTVYAGRSGAFHYTDERTLDLLGGVLSAHLTHSEAFEDSSKESMFDILTGLPNRKAFEQRLGSEVARVRRHGGELSVCLLDLDAFREINDTLGHAVGDEVLRGVARRLARVRGEDTAFRLDGDQFAIIFVGAGAEGARAAAKRLEAGIQADQGCGGVGASWGVAELEAGDPAQLMTTAKVELVDTKRARRGSSESFWNDF